MAGLLITGATVLDPDAPLAQHDIRVAGDTIVEVGPRLRPAGEAVLDGAGMLAMPGLVNAHTHSGQALDRGMAPNLPLDLWIMWVVFGGFPYTADDLYTTAAAGALEMLQTGCTAVLDHLYFDVDDWDNQADAVMQAYADVGIRAAVAPALQDLAFHESLPLHLVPEAEPLDALFPPADPARLMAGLERTVEAANRRDDRISAVVGISAPQRCSDGLLRAAGDFATRLDLGVHTHVLETKGQVLATRQRYDGSVIEHLSDMGLLGPKTSLAHCVWLDTPDYAAVRAAGSVVVHNPLSNLRCGSGMLPLQHLLATGTLVALGADGAASNDNQNMFEVLKFASLLHTLYGDHRTWPRPEQVWANSLAGGGHALGERLGALQPGAKADVVLLTTDRHVLFDRDQVVRSLVLAEHGESVDTVVVGGRVVLQGGHSTVTSEASLRKRAQAHMRRIHEHLPERERFYRQVAPLLEKVEDLVTGSDVGFRRHLEADGVPAGDLSRGPTK